MAGLALLLAASLAAQPAPLGWVCARNFAFGDYQGLIAQDLTPEGARFPIQFSLWHSRLPLRLEWQHLRAAGADPGPPDRLGWEMQLVVDGPGPLWLRLWADGRYAGQALYATREAMSRMRGLQLHRLTLDSVNEGAILARLMAADRWEIEMVGEGGAPLRRERIAAPAPAAIRAAFATQSAWLAAVVERRAPPDCNPIEADQDQEF